jgi:translocation and assembly module TamB
VINLDVGRGVKLRGGAGGNGEGEAGIVYEREY